MTQAQETLAAAIGDRFPQLLRQPSRCGELTYEVPVEEIRATGYALRDEEPFRFEQLSDLCGVDYLAYGQVEWQTQAASHTGFSRGVNRRPPERHPGAPRRLAVVYHLLSLTHNRRLRLKAYCPDDDYPVVPSVTEVWASADWFEREAFDLFGVLFDGHPDLRRILTDYGFVGHPFRKDFPLIGEVEMRYDPEERRVIYQPVSIAPRTLVPRVIRHDNRYTDELTSPRPGDE
jgi:NADH-quinone oxidoreductase subunit C